MSTILHVHTEKSFFDGASTEEEICKRASELGASAISLTNHGTLIGMEEFIEQCNKYNLKPIPGVEAYLSLKITENENARCHLILMAKDYIGYRCICNAVTESHNHLDSSGFPTMNDEILNKYFGPNSEGHRHVFATSACIGGPIAYCFLKNKNIELLVEKNKKSVDKLMVQYDEQIEKADKNKPNNYVQLTQDLEKLEKEIKSYPRQLKKQVELAIGSEKEVLSLKLKTLEKLKGERDEIRKQLKSFTTKERQYEILLAKANSIKKDIDNAVTEIRNLESLIADDNQMFAEATEMAIRLTELFGKQHFLMEMQYHGLEDEAKVMPKLAKIANAINIPLVAANDAHVAYNNEESFEKRNQLRFLRFGNKVDEITEADRQLYIKSDDELKETLLKILSDDVVEKAINNTNKISEFCSFVDETEEHYPVFNPELNANDELERICRERIAWRYANKKWTDEHEKRLVHELKIISSMGFADYHLIVSDFIEYGRLLNGVPEEQINNSPLTMKECREWVRKNGWNTGIAIGPGRGSAVGSLVCYLLGITNLDPLEYGLLFERFLNPERVTMPDIDTDFRPDIRERVIVYVKNKYGYDSVCCILTLLTQAAKKSLDNASRYYSTLKTDNSQYFSYLTKELKSYISSELNAKLEKSEDVILKTFKDNEDALNIWRLARQIEGSAVGCSMHAAGVVIADNRPVSDYIPLQYNNSTQQWTTQCTKELVEKHGLLKMDFLGLKNLRIITNALRYIEKRTGNVIDIDNIDFNDLEIFNNIYSKGFTNVVFQVESQGMKSMLKRFKPNNLFDLIILIAMFRPGPLQYLDDVIAVKNGEKEVEYLVPELESILKDTYGAIVYQEQVMEICQKLAGFSLGQADIVRRYMSKKKTNKLEAERSAFLYGDNSRNIVGCVKNGIPEDKAVILFDQMMDFAKYAFNKSHAAAYAYVSYQTAWLKYYYPIEYLCACLQEFNDNNDKVLAIISDMNELGIKASVPIINEAKANFTIKNDEVMFGFRAITGISSSAVTIEKERDEFGGFANFKDFVLKTSCSEKEIENLIHAGAFDEFTDSRQSLSVALDELYQIKKKIREKEIFIKEGTQLCEFLNKKPNATKKDIDLFLISICAKQFKINSDKIPSLDAITKRIKNAVNTVREKKEEYKEVEIEYVLPDKEQVLKNEKDALRVFLTGHLLDDYDISTTLIEQANEDTFSLSGVVDEVEVRKNRNGEDWITFVLFDKTKTMHCCCFASDYKKYKKYFSQDATIMVTGNCTVDEYRTTDDELVYQFIVKKAQFLTKKKVSHSYYVKDLFEWSTLFEKLRETNCITFDDKAITRVYIATDGKWRVLRGQISELASFMQPYII